MTVTMLTTLIILLVIIITIINMIIPVLKPIIITITPIMKMAIKTGKKYINHHISKFITILCFLPYVLIVH